MCDGLLWPLLMPHPAPKYSPKDPLKALQSGLALLVLKGLSLFSRAAFSSFSLKLVVLASKGAFSGHSSHKHPDVDVLLPPVGFFYVLNSLS